MLLAPFCVLMKQKPVREKKADGSIKDVWAKPMNKILSDTQVKIKLMNFDKDNIKEETMLEAFEYLNRDSFEDSKVKKVNLEIFKLIQWCRSVVSYHILIHPYRVRNFGTINEQSELF